MTVLERLQTRPQSRPAQPTPAPVPSDDRTDAKKLEMLRAKAKGK